MAINFGGTESFTTPIGTTLSASTSPFVQVGRNGQTTTQQSSGVLDQPKTTFSDLPPTGTTFSERSYGPDIQITNVNRTPDINSPDFLSDSTFDDPLTGIAVNNDLSSSPSLFGEPLTDIAMNDELSETPSFASQQSATAEQAATPVKKTEPMIAADDYRVRLSALQNNAEKVYGPNDRSANILAILHSTNGMLFPYTPTISNSQSVNWDAMNLTHTNYEVNSYQKTPSPTISVTGIFTAQTQREGEYCAAVIHYLRTVSKSYFGELDSANGLAGLPPPVLRFHGYGSAMYNNVTCVLKNHAFTFDDNVDMNLFRLPCGLTAKIPARFTISVELGVQKNTTDQRTKFSLDKFRTGELLKSSGSTGWI